MKVAALVPAAGIGARLNRRTAKPFVVVQGQPIFIHTLRNLIKSFPFEEVILSSDATQIQRAERLLKRYRLKKVRVVAGGASRAESVKNALQAVSPSCDWVLVHDAARPLIDRKLVRETILAAKKTGAALCAQPATATVKKVDSARMTVKRTEDRNTIFLAQTPQVFRKDFLVKRYRDLGKKALGSTDCACLFDGTAVVVGIVHGSARNIKITTPDDLEMFKFFLKKGIRGGE